MTRRDKLLTGIDPSGFGLEIGPGYNPVLSKRTGANILVVDHADQQGLIEKYRRLGADTTRIEPVDIVWKRGPLHESVPEHLHGRFDFCLASHVLEHLPDPIAFFKSMSRLLKPDGQLSLAVPDKRYCFDCFQSLTTTADFLEAWQRRASAHSRRALFKHVANTVQMGSALTWTRHERLGSFEFFTPNLREAYDFALKYSDEPDSEYVDCHAWHFTPASFALILLELSALELLPLVQVRSYPSRGCEFFVMLENRPAARQDLSELSRLRLALMRQTVREQAAQWHGFGVWPPKLPVWLVRLLRHMRAAVRRP